MSLKTRTITGVIFGAVMIGGTIASAYSCAILFLIVGVCCLWEYSGLVQEKESASSDLMIKMRQILLTVLGILPALWVANTQLKLVEISPALYFLLLPIFFGLFIFELYSKATRPFEQLAHVLMAILYVGLPTALIEFFCLKQPDFGNLLIMALLAIIWANDSFAYLAGSQIGKTPFFPRISPKKTWEGTLSGFVGAMGIGALCSVLFPALGYSIGAWMLIALVASVFGTLGDLVESLLKRSLGIKDSGTILPGHGGFLDRFDAFIFLIPFVAFVIFFVLEDKNFSIL